MFTLEGLVLCKIGWDFILWPSKPVLTSQAPSRIRRVIMSGVRNRFTVIPEPSAVANAIIIKTLIFILEA